MGASEATEKPFQAWIFRRLLEVRTSSDAGDSLPSLRRARGSWNVAAAGTAVHLAS